MDDASQSQLPFSCSYSPQLPALLHTLGCTIVISTYQAGKLIFISAPTPERLVQLPRTFDRPMGIAVRSDGHQLAVACRQEVILLSNSIELAQHYPKAPNTYDALFLPRLTFHTGPLDIHDLRFGQAGQLLAVNTLFSCISTLSNQYNFQPLWKPPFIDHLAAEDRCHLNGMALANKQARYASAFNRGNSRQSWREDLMQAGLVWDLQGNRPLVEGLAMPHSPRLIGSDLWLLQSGTGELVRVNQSAGTYEPVLKLGGFVRGLAHYQDYLFIGLSKLRKQSTTFRQLHFEKDECAIILIHLPSLTVSGIIRYLNSVEEIYDLQILPNFRRPNILNTRTADHTHAVSIPGQSFWAQ